MVHQHERRVRRLGGKRRARGENAFVGEVHQHVDLVARDAPLGQDILQALLHGEHRRGEFSGPAFLGFERADHPVLFAGGELFQIEFGHQIVDVVNHRAAEQARQPSREHQEIGHVVDVDKLVAPRMPKQVQGDQEKEQGVVDQVFGEGGAFVFQAGSFDDVHARDGFAVRLAGLAPRQEHDPVARFHERLRLALHAGVSSVVGIGRHHDEGHLIGSPGKGLM